MTLRFGRTAGVLWLLAIGLVGSVSLAGVRLSNQDRDGDGARPEALPGAPPPDFAPYRTPLAARVADRRFRARDAMYLASEMQIGSFPFFEQTIEDGLVTSDPDFQYMTTVESYWYSRYNMSSLVTESRLGLHVVYGPYVTEWALEQGRANDNRDRVEYVRSNKGVLLQDIVPRYQDRTGFPRRFEDASPCMLQYASGEPDFVRPVDKGVRFESTENVLRDRDLGRLYGTALPARPTGMGTAANDLWTYRVNYRENFLTVRWGHGDMEPVIDLGAEGQTLMKQVLWMEYFFKGAHHEGRFLGNDPEEGFRGAMLNLMAVSKMLMLKGTMLYDGTRLTGVDPRRFRAGGHYFPHRIRARLRLVGDLPPRPEEFSIEDDSSQLFDQASLLWGLTEYYYFADPTNGMPNWNKVFGNGPRRDGSLMERKYIHLAEGLSNMVLLNIAKMHRREDGVLVSEWRPAGGQGRSLAAEDLGMAMVALANYARRLHAQPENQGLARRMLKDQADFVLNVLRAENGGFPDGYDFVGRRPLEAPPSLLAQGFIIRGLLEAYNVLGDERYRQAATDGYDFMNRGLWDERTGLYRSRAGAGVAVYTPLNLGAALGAMREVIMATKDAGEVERFKRFWVQAIDSSGIQQSEYEETGERDFFVADGDGDGIPRMEYAGGRHGYGIAPVFASRIEIQVPLAPGIPGESPRQTAGARPPAGGAVPRFKGPLTASPESRFHVLPVSAVFSRILRVAVK